MVLREHHGPSEGPVGGSPSLKLPFRIGRLRLGVEDAGPVCGRRVRLELRACAGEALVVFKLPVLEVSKSIRVTPPV